MTAKARPSKYQRRKAGPNAPGAGRPPGTGIRPRVGKQAANFLISVKTLTRLRKRVADRGQSPFVDDAVRFALDHDYLSELSLENQRLERHVIDLNREIRFLKDESQRELAAFKGRFRMDFAKAFSLKASVEPMTAKQFHEFRKFLGLNQKQLADLLGVAESAVVLGERKGPRRRLLLHLQAVRDEVEKKAVLLPKLGED